MLPVFVTIQQHFPASISTQKMAGENVYFPPQTERSDRTRKARPNGSESGHGVRWFSCVQNVPPFQIGVVPVAQCVQEKARRSAAKNRFMASRSPILVQVLPKMDVMVLLTMSGRGTVPPPSALVFGPMDIFIAA
ncbi:hypothetical protein MRS76_15380 [Rhizobiaceae bacterium n13]|uniref:Uncharacterized protein n=1 Tax=Ferirhizobium litorale TaxID=2927786 RepID=A0AAE3QGH1_9HYPH|nr:hypothetical protein [Fererhizobium litorale]MDI7863340.1 hypothetical protein [Fererhizobium litorale]MDI7922926.1 hypothetical protein [Fererhizobium litorale]